MKKIFVTAGLVGIALSCTSFLYAERAWHETEKIIYGLVQELILDKYKRPITVVDLEPQDAAISFAIAHDYDATCVMIDADTKDGFLHECQQHPELETVVLLKTEISYSDLEKLTECEYFDVAFVLKDHNRFLKNWRKTLPLLIKLGDYLVVTIPKGGGRDKYQELHGMLDYLETLSLEFKYQVLHELEGEFVVLFEHHKESLLRAFWIKEKKLKAGAYVVTSTFDEKKLYKSNTKMTSDWEKGINLRTYKGLSGVYPSHEHILSKLAGFNKIDHNDLNPCNVVIQGNNLIAIDFADPRRNANRQRAYERCMNIFKSAR